MATKKKTDKKVTANKKSVTKAKENKQMTRTEYVDTITEMCERLNESGLLDELNMVELEDDLTAEQLTDLFCDGVEYVDSKEKSGELDEDIVSFYENEPWKELPDEDEEEPELEEDGTEVEECECACETEDIENVVEEPVSKPVTKKMAKKKVAAKVAKGKKPVAKKVQEPVEKPKKKVIKKKAPVETEKKKLSKPVVNKKAKTVKKTKPVRSNKVKTGRSVDLELHKDMVTVYKAWDEGDGIKNLQKLSDLIKGRTKPSSVGWWLWRWRKGIGVPEV